MRPFGPTGIFFVKGLRLGAPLGVQPNLMDVSQHAHERIGKATTESSGWLQPKWNRDGRFHDKIAGALPGKIKHGSLAGEESTLRGGNDGGKAGISPRFNALVAEADLVRSAAPRRGIGAVLWAAGGFLRTAGSSFCAGLRRGRQDAYVREGIEEAGIDRKTLAVDDPRFGGDRNVFADGGDDAVSKDDGGVLEGRPGNGHDFRAANGEIRRLAALREESGGSTVKHKECRDADRRHTLANLSETH